MFRNNKRKHGKIIRSKHPAHREDWETNQKKCQHSRPPVFFQRSKNPSQRNLSEEILKTKEKTCQQTCETIGPGIEHKKENWETNDVGRQIKGNASRAARIIRPTHLAHKRTCLGNKKENGEENTEKPKLWLQTKQAKRNHLNIVGHVSLAVFLHLSFFLASFCACLAQRFGPWTAFIIFHARN